MPLPAPAPSWITTSCFAADSAWTAAGIMPTRYSWSLTSFGIPIRTLVAPGAGRRSRSLGAHPARAARLPVTLLDHGTHKVGRTRPGAPQALRMGGRRHCPPPPVGTGEWSGQRDLNPRHQAWEACALPLSYARSRPRQGTSDQRAWVISHLLR